MKKILGAFLISVFFLSVPVQATDKEGELSKEEQFLFFANQENQSLYHTSIPQNPRLYQDSLLYKDVNLTEVSSLHSADQGLEIKQFIVNDQTTPVFQLSDGSYIEASQLLIFDDVVEFEEELEQIAFLKNSAEIWEAPFTIGVNPVKSGFTAYQQVKVTKQAKTYSGLYYYIDQKGWVLAEETRPAEHQLDVLQEMLLDKYSQDNYAVYVKRLDDGATAQINANRTMYGASVTKLATVYATQKQLSDGDLKLTDKLKYSKDVNNFQGAYDTAGAGTISKTPDNKDYTVEQLLAAIGKRSDNAASNILTYYVSDKNSEEFQQLLFEAVGAKWDMVERDLSAKMAALMMEQIYLQDGKVLDFLTDTEFKGTRISKGVPVKVAHKTGDAYDFRHDVAIVYADRPFVLSIFTDGADHEDITKIAKDVYSILK